MQKLKEEQNYFLPVLAVRLKQFMMEKMEFAEICSVFRFAGEPLRLSWCDEKRPRAPE